MKSVLLTGATGFLGRYIADECRAQGDSLLTVGRGSGNEVQCDLSKDVPALNGAFDWVVHCMGKAHIVPSSPAESKDFFDVNVQGTRNLCEAITRTGHFPKAFIFISTVAVYGLDEGDNISEEAPLLGSTPYAKSKIEAESFLHEWCAAHEIVLTVLRLPLVAGSKPPGNLGSMIEGIRNNRYFNIDGGKARKSVVMAQDVAACLPMVSSVGGVYNLSDGEHPSFAQLGAIIARQLGKRSPSSIPIWVASLVAFAGNFLGSKAPLNSDKLRKITATLTFSDQKARRQFGWKPAAVVENFQL